MLWNRREEIKHGIGYLMRPLIGSDQIETVEIEINITVKNGLGFEQWAQS